jgi:hypothetical protein
MSTVFEASGSEAAASYTVRKFKASDLPLPSATRSAIDGLAHSFKKKGGYDSIRKQVWEKFEASVCYMPSFLFLFGGEKVFLVRLSSVVLTFLVRI